MNRFACIGGLVGGIAILCAQPPAAPEVTILFTGDINGYLSPCGCAKPQIGGIKRMSSVIRSLSKTPNTFHVDLGNWMKTGGRQDQLKAEAIADSFKSLNSAVLNIGSQDALMGEAFLQSLNDIAGKRMASSNLGLPWAPGSRRVGGLVVVGIATGPLAQPLNAEEVAVADLVLLSGSREDATRLAEKVKPGALILFSLHGDPLRGFERVGHALLGSVGDKGRHLGKVERVGGAWVNYSMIELGPEHPDDERASALYKQYTMRVADERLIDELPRMSGGPKFVGSKNCAPCHGITYRTWKETAHADALHTLEETGNDRDPECVGCHVVALDHITGFRDRKATPALSDVGCENCHGAGYEHAKKPQSVRLGRVGEASCAPCHNSEHSPSFNFREYWKKIKH